MKTLCCSTKCEKRFECAKADINNDGVHYIEDFYSFGSGTFTDNGCKIEAWCGEEGNYKMFEPIEEVNIEVKIKFPFQYLNQYLRGEISLDESVNRTIDEVDRLIREYVEKHNLKT